mmetsp:Transcript_33998/g.100186  ORF Transcript_33998/g.100186 Transcript_33998/m.100186 type:complete len:154 (-) Transcript_33998:1054-1515(-)
MRNCGTIRCACNIATEQINETILKLILSHSLFIQYTPPSLAIDLPSRDVALRRLLDRCLPRFSLGQRSVLDLLWQHLLWQDLAHWTNQGCCQASCNGCQEEEIINAVEMEVESTFIILRVVENGGGAKILVENETCAATCAVFNNDANVFKRE